MVEEIITGILKAEGWDKYTNHPADKGGPTKWGITQSAWGDYYGRTVTEADIKAISEAQARDFYEKVYVVNPQFSLLPESIQELVIDSGVNSGVRAATKWLQRAINVKQDGKIGPRTLAAVHMYNPMAIALWIISYRCKLYGRLVSKDKELQAARQAGFNLQAEFAAGWNNRIMQYLEALARALS